MTELSAHHVDEVLPFVPVRRWVLTLPFLLRYHLAWNHERARAVLAVFLRALLGFYRDAAQRRGIEEGRSGSALVPKSFIHRSLGGGGQTKDGLLAPSAKWRGEVVVHGREGETAAAPKFDEHYEGVDSGGSVDGGEGSATGSTLPRSRTLRVRPWTENGFCRKLPSSSSTVSSPGRLPMRRLPSPLAKP